MLFQPPPETRYDLRFTIVGVPVRVHPLFWVIALLFGASAGDLLHIMIWVVAVFISILVHELGHALVMRRFGMASHVVLHVSGGLTIPEPVSWGNRWASVGLQSNQEILISLAGPAAGFFLAALVLIGVAAAGGSIIVNWLFGIIPFPTAILPIGGNILNSFVMMLLWVNIFWGLINLMPVFPLDGGNIARQVLLKADPLDGVRKSLWISVIAGTIIALAGLFLLGSIYMALLFGFLAFQSYQSIQGSSGLRF